MRGSAPSFALANRDELSTAERPPLVDATADYEIPRQLWSGWCEEGKPRRVRRLMRDDEHGVVTRRIFELQASLSPFTAAEQDRAVAAMAAMLGGFRSLRRDADEVAVAGLDGLRHVLAAYPLWAIEAGCLAIASGDAWLDGEKLSRRFPPNDAEICGVIKEIMKPYRKTLDNALALLSAPVEPPLLLERRA